MIQNDEITFSFDVIPLFTNIPVDLAIQATRERLEQSEIWKSRCGDSNLTRNEITNLLRTWLNSTTFLYNGEHHQQIFGTAMGSAIVANLIMEDYESKLFTKYELVATFLASDVLMTRLRWYTMTILTILTFFSSSCARFFLAINSR